MKFKTKRKSKVQEPLMIRALCYFFVSKKNNRFAFVKVNMVIIVQITVIYYLISIMVE